MRTRRPMLSIPVKGLEVLHALDAADGMPPRERRRGRVVEHPHPEAPLSGPCPGARVAVDRVARGEHLTARFRLDVVDPQRLPFVLVPPRAIGSRICDFTTAIEQPRRECGRSNLYLLATDADVD